jgi:hypothetical protein
MLSRIRAGLDQSSYFSFTKSKTKIAQIPTVIGNCASCASRSAPPRGIAKVSRSIARAVSMPSANLVFEVIVCSPTIWNRPEAHSRNRAVGIILSKPAEDKLPRTMPRLFTL